MKLASRMRRFTLLMLGIASAIASSSANAEEASSQDMQPQFEAFVNQLGDDAYPVRERAAAALLAYGLPTKEALIAGMKNADLEIAERSQRVWSDVRLEAGWQQARETLGNTPQSRDLFEKMFVAAPERWLALAESPSIDKTLFDECLQRLQEMQLDKDTNQLQGALANVLYFGVRIKRERPETELPRIEYLLRIGRIRQAVEEDKILRRLVAQWTNATISDGPAFERLIVALQDRRIDAVDIAREILRDTTTPATQRQYALLALTETKDPEDESLNNAALDDTSLVDILFSQGQLIRSELRDVALAVQITRAGQDPSAFGFKFLRLDDNTIYSPSSLGFITQADRELAFKNWSTFSNSAQQQ